MKYPSTQGIWRIVYSAVCTTICITVCTITAGCSTIPRMDFSAIDPSVLKKPGPATSVIASWEPAVNNDDGQRGFAGKVYFYDKDMKHPVKIKGSVVVYAFDEDDRAPGDSKPNEGYVFDNKMLNGKGIYSKTMMGHSYNLWIPWDAEGPQGYAKTVSLIVRYIPEKGGASVVSSMATIRLPGRSLPQTEQTQREQTLLASRKGTLEHGTIEDVTMIRQMLAGTEDNSFDGHAERFQTMRSVMIR